MKRCMVEDGSVQLLKNMNQGKKRGCGDMEGVKGSARKGDGRG